MHQTQTTGVLTDASRPVHEVLARRTITDYESDWRMYDAWCRQKQREPLPADSAAIAQFARDALENHRIRTVRRYLCAIVHYHRALGYGKPDVSETLAILNGTQRLRSEEPIQKLAVSVDQLRTMMEHLESAEEPRRTRDRAVILFGFATALRRSSIVAVLLDHIRFQPEGMIVYVPREKQDQAGKGRYIGVPFAQNEEVCAVRALERWLRLRGREPGWLFDGLRNGLFHPERPMHHSTVAHIVKRAIAAPGTNPDSYGAHSLRAGFITAALESGAGEIVTARHTGHRSVATLGIYLRSQNLFRGNVCATIGL